MYRNLCYIVLRALFIVLITWYYFVFLFWWLEAATSTIVPCIAVNIINVFMHRDDDEGGRYDDGSCMDRFFYLVITVFEMIHTSCFDRPHGAPSGVPVFMLIEAAFVC